VDDADRCRAVFLLRFAQLTHTGCRFHEVASFQFALCHVVSISEKGEDGKMRFLKLMLGPRDLLCGPFANNDAAAIGKEV
jgi:hypothetical protein